MIKTVVMPIAELSLLMPVFSQDMSRELKNMEKRKLKFSCKSKSEVPLTVNHFSEHTRDTTSILLKPYARSVVIWSYCREGRDKVRKYF